MAKGTTILVFLALSVVGQALTPSTYLTPVDQDRLAGIFQSARPYGDDLQTVHYSVLGYTLLGRLEEPQKTCDIIKKHVDTNSVESLFYASAVAANLKLAGKINCQFNTGSAETVLNAAITEDTPTITIYQAVAALTNLGLKLDAPKVTNSLNAALKTDDSPLSHGYAFYAASYLSGDLTKFHDLIEDIIEQADEVDDKYLQFEGGLYTSAIVVDGAYKLAAAAKKAPTLTSEKVIQFSNYFLSRKHVQSLKNAATILSVIKTLSDNKYHVPVAVTLASQVSVSEKNPMIQVKVGNLMGTSLGKLTVMAEQARHLGTDAVVLSKEQFTAKKDSLYDLDFMKVKPARGFYKLNLNVNPEKADARLIGTTGAEVEVKVTTQVAIENVEIGVADKEQTKAPRTTKLQHPNKAANILEADYHQKISMRFQLQDKSSNEVMTAHQVFLRFTNQKTKQEIIFVAEADSSDAYKFDLDVGAKSKDFGYMSGKYALDLIVGDAIIENPFKWAVADVQLSFPDGGADDKEPSTRYSKLPEIKHMFREPEKRPPTMVSNLFTGLVFVPLLILFILWMKIGANISNFSFSMSAVGFHLGLAAIFGLYYCYWTHLNMFDTLRYLALLGLPTFLFGNRLLSGIAAKRK